MRLGCSAHWPFGSGLLTSLAERLISLLGEQAGITPVQALVCQVAADALDVLTFPADSSIIICSDRRIPRVGKGGRTAVFMSTSPVGVPPMSLHHYQHSRVVPRTGCARFRHPHWHPYGACRGTVEARGRTPGMSRAGHLPCILTEGPWCRPSRTP